MKKLVLLFAVVLFTSSSMFAQVAEQKKAPAKATPAKQAKTTEQANTNPNAPIITFDKVTHDYGEIEQHGNGRCEFKFTNEGKEPLILSNVRSSCGCTVPEWPKKPIAPGEEGTIEVTFNSAGKQGLQNKTITLVANTLPNRYVLAIKGEVLAPEQ